MIEETNEWFVTNVKDATWVRSPEFGMRCVFEARDALFKSTGVGIAVLEPGKPACRYHRENAQEDFLVLSGECLLLVCGEERRLQAWDFVHCAPGVDHVFVGAGDGPSVVVMIGDRPQGHELFYPNSELARKHGAETAEPSSDPLVAYAGAKAFEPCDAPDWLPSGKQR
ncbi:MAG: cupin domain-containing protein [Planctomycetota bacterium]|jgi:uncharacterized cupin superfamily protein